jgi:hypothetical protein
MLQKNYRQSIINNAMEHSATRGRTHRVEPDS